MKSLNTAMPIECHTKSRKFYFSCSLVCHVHYSDICGNPTACLGQEMDNIIDSSTFDGYDEKVEERDINNDAEISERTWTNYTRMTHAIKVTVQNKKVRDQVENPCLFHPGHIDSTNFHSSQYERWIMYRTHAFRPRILHGHTTSSMFVTLTLNSLAIFLSMRHESLRKSTSFNSFRRSSQRSSKNPSVSSWPPKTRIRGLVPVGV